MHGRYEQSAGLRNGDIDLIKGGRIFRDVAHDAVVRTLARCTVKTLANGTHVFRQGDPFSAIYLVLEGHLKVFQHTSSGKTVILGIFGPGESVAEAVLFMDHHYPASCTAVGETRVLRMAANVAEEVIGYETSVARGVQRSVAQHLQDMAEHAEHIKGLSGTQRVAAYLLKLAGTDKGPCTLRLPYRFVGTTAAKRMVMYSQTCWLNEVGQQVKGNHPRLSSSLQNDCRQAHGEVCPAFLTKRGW